MDKPAGQGREVAALTRLTGDCSFTVTYGPVDRLWCNACDKAELLPDLSGETVRRLESEHQCGPRTSAWSSRGWS